MRCFGVGLWKVAVVTGVSEPQQIDDSQEQAKAAAEDVQKATEAPGEQQQQLTSVDARQDNRDELQAEQSLQPESHSNDDSTSNDTKRQNEDDEQVEQSLKPTSPPTCPLVIVLYGDRGKTEPLLLGKNEFISEIKFQPGTAEKFIVS